MKLVEVLWERLFPDAPEPKTSIVDQFLCYWNKEDPFDEGSNCEQQYCAMSIACVCLIEMPFCYCNCNSKRHMQRVIFYC